MGFSATLDILGEHVLDKTQAQDITSQYCMLYKRINDSSLDCTISVKPSHVGLSISQTEAILNMRKITENISIKREMHKENSKNNSYNTPKEKTIEPKI